MVPSPIVGEIKNPQIVWFKFFPGDFLKHIARLPTRAIGPYMLLLLDYFCNGPIADSDETLAASSRINTLDGWRELRPLIQPYFAIKDGF